jgi:hypothetical protein
MLEFMAVPLSATMRPRTQLGHTQNWLGGAAPRGHGFPSELPREPVERLNRVVDSDEPMSEFGTGEWHTAEAA